MKSRRLFLAALVLNSLLLMACAPNPGSAAEPQDPPPANRKTPRIVLNLERVPASGRVEVRGTGFTPSADVRSHLKRPNGVEFPVLPIYTDEKGEFFHEIDTALFLVGTHEVWVIDSSGVSSNVATFESTRDQSPILK